MMRKVLDYLGVSEKRWTRAENEEVRPAKTLWDWLQLLVVPVALAVLAIAFNASQSSRDAKREETRNSHELAIAAAARRQDRATAAESRLDETLRTYLARISDLMLDRNLLRSRQGSTVQAVARTLTVTALHRLDGRRKGEVLRFLEESRLIGTVRVSGSDGSAIIFRPTLAKISLRDADLRDADLTRSVLLGANLAESDLRNAHLDGARLNAVSFWDAGLHGASFRGAQMSKVDLGFSDLRNAVFDRASFYDWVSLHTSCVTGARFRGAYLDGATFGDVQGRHVDFTGASLAGEQLRDAELMDSTMPARVTGGLPKGWGPEGARLSQEDQGFMCAQFSLSSHIARGKIGAQYPQRFEPYDK